MPTGKNEGSARLGEAVEKFGSIRGLAKELGQDYAAVWRWLNGERVPEYHSRKAIQDSLGIPMEAWDLETKTISNAPPEATP
jgi:transcriptional regulator with XRE-family HTH domain